MRHSNHSHILVNCSLTTCLSLSPLNLLCLVSVSVITSSTLCLPVFTPFPTFPTSSKKGFQEERDGTRLRDARSRPVACYACGGSSIPLNSLTTDPESTWRQIVSCDYCALHWHLDCLSPPLASMPNSGRKWMCPNHAEQVMVSTLL